MTVSGPPADDATLVAGVLAGDRQAFAGVYERYADRLHDFAHSMLRNREEAADCVADSFVVMAEKVGQLRDPSRLRPWLYAVVRNECLRTLRGRAREAHDDEWLEAMPDHGSGPEQQVTDAAAQDELRDLVWDAIEGLNDRDRALLDLHLRQGLDGAELAAAMDVTPQNSYVMLSRARDQVERSLGALLIARRGSDLCADLTGILGDWDGRFSPLIRKRVARHIDNCETCEARRRLMVSPLALLAGVPAFAAPASLRDRVLGDERLVAHYVEDPVLPAPGPPGPPGAGGSGTARRVLLVVGLVVVLLALSGGAVVAWWPRETEPAVATDPISDAPSTATTIPTAPATTGAASSSAPPSISPAEPTATPTEPSTESRTEPRTEPSTETTIAAPGELRVSARTLRLGARSAGSVRLSNPGGSALTYAAKARVSWLSVSRSAGTLEAGAGSTLTITADRSGLGEGSRTGTVAVTWSGGTVLVSVQVTVDHAPVVGGIDVGGPTDCTGRTVATTVTDTTLQSVQVAWSGPSGSGQAAMAASGGRFSASIGPFPIGGTVTATVTATDAAGHTTTRRTSFDVDPCPG